MLPAISCDPPPSWWRTQGPTGLTAIGAASYAERQFGGARSFRHPRSLLEQAVNGLVLAVMSLVVLLCGRLGLLAVASPHAHA